LNVARIGKFSSDRTVTEYAREIWHIGQFEKKSPVKAPARVAAVPAKPKVEPVAEAEVVPEVETKQVAD
jgi:hypothetical protein